MPTAILLARVVPQILEMPTPEEMRVANEELKLQASILREQAGRDLLQAQGNWKVVGEAKGGREAVEMVKKLKPDIAIVDITMPDMDGLEVTRPIQDVARETQILILTMHESDQMVRRVMEMGARGYVLKSDLSAHLIQAVKDLANGKISLTPKVSEMVLEGFLKAGESKQAENGHARPTAREIEITRLLAAGKTCWRQEKRTKKLRRRWELRSGP